MKRLRPALLCLVVLATSIPLVTVNASEKEKVCDRNTRPKKCDKPPVTPSGLAIKVLSNRADLVSGGDALVEITRAGGTVDAASVTLNGADITSSFAPRSNGHYMGVVTGLIEGTNDLVASSPTGGGARLTITNHPIGGPVFSGPQLQPWICTTASNGLGDPVDDKCNAPTKVEYFYQAEGSTSFASYDPDNPPTDVRTVTTDDGDTVPYIIRQETGTQNRGIYRTAVLYDPSQPWTPWEPQAGWNHKLYYPFGASCGTMYSQASAQNVQNNNALSRGFMVATSSLNVLANNCNTVLSAETVMMLKEYIVDNYGEIRYTFGNGSSGGSIGQNMVANSYPGLLQGITEGANFADTVTTGNEVFDCHLLFHYFTGKSQWNAAAMAAVTGSGSSVGTCAGWEALFSAVENPRDGAGVPADQAYHPETNPGGARGRYEDFERNVWGLRPEEVWTAPEKAIGRGFAKALYDNVGVQFGLSALQGGLITTEQFVDLNEKIGGFDVDFNLTQERSAQAPGASGTAYQAGRIVDGEYLDEVAMIDSRGTGNVDPLLIHTMHHSFALKDRIANANGSADNHVVWRGGSPAPAFDVMDQWLSSVEADTSERSLAEKIVVNRPDEAEDMCFAGDQAFTDKETCDTLWPYYGAPRIVAGSPTTHDIIKCELKPLDRNDPAYGFVPFTEDQWARLQATFPTGVCDWSRDGVDRQESVPWMTYSDGPGTGHPLPTPPMSQSL
ncbi:MAG TPA: DUF6351 family protein [Actinomycetota bacterium]|nr:DUF6351 family protein [Actinomycetota bacterium]